MVVLKHLKDWSYEQLETPGGALRYFPARATHSGLEVHPMPTEESRLLLTMHALTATTTKGIGAAQEAINIADAVLRLLDDEKDSAAKILARAREKLDQKAFAAARHDAAKTLVQSVAGAAETVGYKVEGQVGAASAWSHKITCVTDQSTINVFLGVGPDGDPFASAHQPNLRDNPTPIPGITFERGARAFIDNAAAPAERRRNPATIIAEHVENLLLPKKD